MTDTVSLFPGHVLWPWRFKMCQLLNMNFINVRQNNVTQTNSVLNFCQAGNPLIITRNVLLCNNVAPNWM